MTTVIFQRLRQPVVFGYLLAGMIVGPHVPIPIVVDEDIVRTLAEMVSPCSSRVAVGVIREYR